MRYGHSHRVVTQGLKRTSARISYSPRKVVVGGSALIAAATVFIHREWALLVSMVAGLAMVGYLVVETISIDDKVGSDLPIYLALQLFYLVLGVAHFGLAGFLWMREWHGSRHFHLGRASHG